MFYLLLFTYVLGGLTFVPLLVAALVAAVLYTSPVVERDPAERLSVQDENRKRELEVHASLERDAGVPRLYRAGWLTVRRTYEPIQAGDGTYMGAIASGYRTFLDNRSKDPKRTRPKDLFYAVLKQSVLFLYEDEEQNDCAAAIEVTLHDVSLFPEARLDGEMYVKRRSIRLLGRELPATKEEEKTDGDPKGDSKPGSQDNVAGRPMPWYIFAKNNVEKEDWYHALVASSKLSGPDAASTFARDASLFNPDDMAKLLDNLDNSPDPIPMRWLNAFVGRLFLSAYRTDALEMWIINRIMKKLTRVKTPTFLSAIKVREVNVGTTTPFFSKPMLKELTIDGDASMEVHVHYQGAFRITIETVATINLGARFKPYTVNLVLAVIVKEVEGKLLLKIKRPPTNRLWFGFTSMPRLVMHLEPVVSTRQIKWSMILKPIESRIREVVLESIVLPHLDDLAFFPTQGYFHRAGIWGDAARKEVLVSVDAAAAEAAAAEEGKEGEKEEGEGTAGEESGADPTRQQTSASLPEKLAGGPSSSSLTSIQSAPQLGDTTPTKKKTWFGSTRKPTSAASTPPRAPSTEPTASSDATEDAAAKLREVLRSRSESPKVVASSSIDDILTGQRDVSRSVPTSTAELPEEDEEVEQLGRRSRSVSGPLLDIGKPAMVSNDSSSSFASAGASSTSSVLSNNGEQVADSSRDPSPASMVRRVPPPPPRSLVSQVEPPPPPPRRHTASQSVDSASLSSPSSSSLRSPQGTGPNASSVLSVWRQRATDKEAIAAGMTSAKDAMKKWGATWQAKRKANQPPQFTNGFNPIDISALESPGREPDLTDLDMRPPAKPSQQTSESSSPRESADGNDASISGPSYRDYRAGLESSSSTVDPPAQLAADSATPSTTPLSQSPAAESLLSEDRPGTASSRRKSVSRNSVVSFADDASTTSRRSRNISTSNGQFMPSAAQTTRSLSISSAKLDHPSSNPSSPTASPVVKPRENRDAPTSPRSPSKSVSSGSAYRPAPTMSIPGIKDSSHRFAMGSETLAKATSAPAEPSAFPKAPGSDTSNASDKSSEAPKADKVPSLSLELPSPPASDPAFPTIKQTSPTPPTSATATDVPSRSRNGSTVLSSVSAASVELREDTNIASDSAEATPPKPSTTTSRRVPVPAFSSSPSPATQSLGIGSEAEPKISSETVRPIAQAPAPLLGEATPTSTMSRRKPPPNEEPEGEEVDDGEAWGLEL